MYITMTTKTVKVHITFLFQVVLRLLTLVSPLNQKVPSHMGRLLNFLFQTTEDKKSGFKRPIKGVMRKANTVISGSFTSFLGHLSHENFGRQTIWITGIEWMSSYFLQEQGIGHLESLLGWFHLEGRGTFKTYTRVKRFSFYNNRQ